MRLDGRVVPTAQVPGPFRFFKLNAGAMLVPSAAVGTTFNGYGHHSVMKLAYVQWPAV
jgi:hypothetical protein